MYGTLISSVTVGAGGASSIDFTNIPQTPYTDLVLVYSTHDTYAGGNSNTRLRFNGSTSGYTEKLLYGLGTSVGSLNGGDGTAIAFLYTVGAGFTNGVYSNGIVTIPNYAGSTNKSVSVDVVLENNGNSTVLGLVAGLWSNTAAITSLSLSPQNTATFLQYSTAYLYGLTKGSGGATVS